MRLEVQYFFIIRSDAYREAMNKRSVTNAGSINYNLITSQSQVALANYKSFASTRSEKILSILLYGDLLAVLANCSNSGSEKKWIQLILKKLLSRSDPRVARLLLPSRLFVSFSMQICCCVYLASGECLQIVAVGPKHERKILLCSGRRVFINAIQLVINIFVSRAILLRKPLICSIPLCD